MGGSNSYTMYQESKPVPRIGKIRTKRQESREEYQSRKTIKDLRELRFPQP